MQEFNVFSDRVVETKELAFTVDLSGMYDDDSLQSMTVHIRCPEADVDFSLTATLASMWDWVPDSDTLTGIAVYLATCMRGKLKSIAGGTIGECVKKSTSPSQMTECLRSKAPHLWDEIKKAIIECGFGI